MRACRLAPGRRGHQECLRHQLPLGHLDGIWQLPKGPSAWCVQAFGVHRGSLQSLSGWLKLGGCCGVPQLAVGCHEPSRDRPRLGPTGLHPHACALRLLGALIERLVSRSETRFPLCFLAGGASVALSPQEARFATTSELDPVFFT